MNTIKIAATIVLVALSIGTNYAFASFYNVKPMDLFTFVAGVLFGPLVGISVGIMSWSVYGVLNPYGFVPQIWIATMLSETLYGIIGGLLHRARFDFYKASLARGLFMANLGFLLTVAYDLLTTVAYASVFGSDFLVAFILGVPFTLVHEVSNAVLFGACGIPLVSAARMILTSRRMES